MKLQAKYALLGVGVLVLAIVATKVDLTGSRLWRSIYPPGTKARTVSTKPIHLKLVDGQVTAAVQLVIPQTYLVDAKNWRGGVQEAIRIETQLPDLMPASALPPVRGVPGTAEYEESMAAFRNGIAITLLSSKAEMAKAMQNYRRDITRANQSLDDSERYDPISPDAYDLEGYREFRCSRNSFPGSIFDGHEYCVDSHSEHYLPLASDHAKVYLICTRLMEPRFAARSGCLAYSEFAGHQLNFVFRRSELHRWRDFYDGVQQLLNRFATHLD